MQISDEKIIEEFFDRDEKAIADTNSKYGNLCRCISYNILQNDSDTDECINTAYMNVWNAIPPARPKSFKAYLCEVVRNTAYVNTLPMSHTPSTNVRVKEVDVLKYGENAYCYLFINTVSYDGINLSYLRMSEACTSSGQSCNKFIWSTGSMVVTDEVDHIYGNPRSFIMTEETESSEIISFEKAVDILSNAMIADYVVTGAELLYLPDMPADQRAVIEDYKCRTSAKWKLTLYNESDGLYYHCYINAKDGTGFEYFKTEK